MNLVKKILATAGLFSMIACSQIFAEQKESEKYKTLFLEKDSRRDTISLGWDTNSDGKEDLIGIYMIFSTEMKDVYEADYVGVNNNANKTDENEIKDIKYSKFLLAFHNGGGLILGLYNTNNNFNKLYYYKRIGSNGGVHELKAIQEDTNNDGKFEEYEYTFKAEDFTPVEKFSE